MGSIVVKNVGKAYKQYPRKLSKVIEWLFPFFGKRHTLKWVLKDISFDIKAGEAVGIVGVNGAGKSTLLKMITGTSQPTTGSIEMQGRVAALLELGMGFHPEFTGRENAYMSGQLLGISRSEMDRLLPSIEEFAEIGDYIDMPVRVYSSGMQVRLAFSVATAIRPDILIVDEALSVGDVAFQSKSFERIKQFKRLGTTLFIVSHDKQAILNICNRSLYIKNGRVSLISSPLEVFDLYNSDIANPTDNGEVFPTNSISFSGNKKAEIVSYALIDKFGKDVDVTEVNEKIILNVSVNINEDIKSLVFGFEVRNRLGEVVFGTNSYNLGKELEDLKKGERLAFSVEILSNFGVGDYSFTLALHSGANHLESNYYWINNVKIFSVVNSKKKSFNGVLWLDTDIKIERNKDE